jgi:hypothetical protein
MTVNLLYKIFQKEMFMGQYIYFNNLTQPLTAYTTPLLDMKNVTPLRNPNKGLLGNNMSSPLRVKFGS